jgi:hypothetical protein
VNNLREMNTRSDHEAVTQIPYGQWGMERPGDTPADPAAKRKTSAPKTSGAKTSGAKTSGAKTSAAPPAPVVSAVTPMTLAPQ